MGVGPNTGNSQRSRRVVKETVQNVSVEPGPVNSGLKRAEPVNYGQIMEIRDCMEEDANNNQSQDLRPSSLASDPRSHQPPDDGVQDTVVKESQFGQVSNNVDSAAIVPVDMQIGDAQPGESVSQRTSKS